MRLINQVFMQEQNSKRTALVVGATGVVGSYCVEYLASDNNYDKVILLLRRKLEINSKKVIQHVIDFDNIQQYHSIIKADDIFCCIGTTAKKVKDKKEYYKIDVTYPYEIGKIALENHAKQYLIVTAVGANSRSSSYYLKFKGQVEELLIDLHYPVSHFFRPSLIIGNRSEFRIFEKLFIGITKLTSLLMVGKLRKYKPLHGWQIAKSMVKNAKTLKEGVFVHHYSEILD